jgi:hypothetical protein
VSSKIQKSQYRNHREKDLLRIEKEYIADTEVRSVDYWYMQVCGTNPKSSDLTSVDVLNRASQERWKEKRQMFRNGVLSAWLKHQSQKILHQKIVETNQVIEIRNALQQYVKPGTDADGKQTLPVEPKSYEGVVGAFVKVDELMSKRRDDIMESLDPMLATAGKAATPDDRESPFNEKEQREIAYSLLKQRRIERQKRLGIYEPDENDDDSNESENESESTTDQAQPGTDKSGTVAS